MRQGLKRVVKALAAQQEGHGFHSQFVHIKVGFAFFSFSVWIGFPRLTKACTAGLSSSRPWVWSTSGNGSPGTALRSGTAQVRLSGVEGWLKCMENKVHLNTSLFWKSYASLEWLKSKFHFTCKANAFILRVLVFSPMGYNCVDYATNIYLKSSINSFQVQDAYQIYPF